MPPASLHCRRVHSVANTRLLMPLLVLIRALDFIGSTLATLALTGRQQLARGVDGACRLFQVCGIVADGGVAGTRVELLQTNAFARFHANHVAFEQRKELVASLLRLLPLQLRRRTIIVH